MLRTWGARRLLHRLRASRARSRSSLLYGRHPTLRSGRALSRGFVVSPRRWASPVSCVSARGFADSRGPGDGKDDVPDLSEMASKFSVPELLSRVDPTHYTPHGTGGHEPPLHPHPQQAGTQQQHGQQAQRMDQMRRQLMESTMEEKMAMAPPEVRETIAHVDALWTGKRQKRATRKRRQMVRSQVRKSLRGGAEARTKQEEWNVWHDSYATDLAPLSRDDLQGERARHRQALRMGQDRRAELLERLNRVDTSLEVKKEEREADAASVRKQILEQEEELRRFQREQTLINTFLRAHDDGTIGDLRAEHMPSFTGEPEGLRSSSAVTGLTDTTATTTKMDLFDQRRLHPEHHTAVARVAEYAVDPTMLDGRTPEQVAAGVPDPLALAQIAPDSELRAVHVDGDSWLEQDLPLPASYYDETAGMTADPGIAGLSAPTQLAAMHRSFEEIWETFLTSANMADIPVEKRKRLRSLPHDEVEFFASRPRTSDNFILLMQVQAEKGLPQLGVQTFMQLLEHLEEQVAHKRYTYEAGPVLTTGGSGGREDEVNPRVVIACLSNMLSHVVSAFQQEEQRRGLHKEGSMEVEPGQLRADAPHRPEAQQVHNQLLHPTPRFVRYMTNLGRYLSYFRYVAENKLIDRVDQYDGLLPAHDGPIGMEHQAIHPISVSREGKRSASMVLSPVDAPPLVSWKRMQALGEFELPVRVRGDLELDRLESSERQVIREIEKRSGKWYSRPMELGFAGLHSDEDLKTAHLTTVDRLWGRGQLEQMMLWGSDKPAGSPQLEAKSGVAGLIEDGEAGGGDVGSGTGSSDSTGGVSDSGNGLETAQGSPSASHTPVQLPVETLMPGVYHPLPAWDSTVPVGEFMFDLDDTHPLLQFPVDNKERAKGRRGLGMSAPLPEKLAEQAEKAGAGALERSLDTDYKDRFYQHPAELPCAWRWTGKRPEDITIYSDDEMPRFAPKAKYHPAVAAVGIQFVAAVCRYMTLLQIPPGAEIAGALAHSLCELGLPYLAHETVRRWHFHHGMELDAVIISTLCSGYRRLGLAREAWDCFYALRATGVAPDAVCFNVMLDVCAGNEMAEKALDLLEEMQFFDVEPSLHSYTSAIKACAARPEYYPRAMQLFEELLAKRMVPDEMLMCTLFEACAKNRDLRNGILLFGQAFGAFGMPRTTRLYNRFLRCVYMSQSADDVVTLDDGSTLTQEDRIELAEWVLKDMEERGLTPNEETVAAAVNCYAGALRLQRARLAFAQLHRKYGITPTIRTYEPLLHMFARAKRVKEAVETLHAMEAISDAMKVDESGSQGVNVRPEDVPHAERVAGVDKEMRVRPNMVPAGCYGAVLKACVQKKAYGEGLKIYRHMDESGMFIPDVLGRFFDPARYGYAWRGGRLQPTQSQQRRKWARQAPSLKNMGKGLQVQYDRIERPR